MKRESKRKEQINEQKRNILGTAHDNLEEEKTQGKEILTRCSIIRIYYIPTIFFEAFYTISSGGDVLQLFYHFPSQPIGHITQTFMTVKGNFINKDDDLENKMLYWKDICLNIVLPTYSSIRC